MGIIRRTTQKLKKAELEKETEFKKRLEEFNKEMFQLCKKHRVSIRPCLGRYGAEMEITDVPQKSNIIIK